MNGRQTGRTQERRQEKRQMTINVKVPNCGWQSENLADDGTGQILMSRITTNQVEVQVRVNGESKIATIGLKMSPRGDGAKFYGEYVSISEAFLSEIDENGDAAAPYAQMDTSNLKLVYQWQA
jgi:hypothetical protein